MIGTTVAAAAALLSNPAPAAASAPTAPIAANAPSTYSAPTGDTPASGAPAKNAAGKIPPLDPTGTWTVSANGRCFGSAWYADGDDPDVGNDFACSHKLSRFSPPASATLKVNYNSYTHMATLTGGPSQAERKIPIDAEGFGASSESYRNETGPVDDGCSVHSFFTEVVQFHDGQLSYAYVDNSEFIPDQEDDVDENGTGSAPAVAASSCDVSISKLHNALEIGKASPGTTALVESGAIDVHRFIGIRQTSIYYLYDGTRGASTALK